MSSVLDTPKNSAVAEANNETPKQPTHEVKAAIVRQVEFYFSDANLPTDKFLLKQVQQGHQGFVPIKLIAQFKRVKSLTKDVDLITDALKGSADLVVSPDNIFVRRLKPLPNVNEHDIKKRTVLATQIPGIPSIESVTDLFSRYGAVKLVRICPPGSTEKLPQWLTVANPSVQAAAASNQLFALVELVAEDAAQRAVADSGYNGMQVRHLLFDQQQPTGPHHHPQQQQQAQQQQDLQQQAQQHQQHQQMPNGAGRGNHRRNRSGFQPGAGPPSADMLRADMARMQLRSTPSGPLPFHMDAPSPAPHHAPPHYPSHPHHALRGPPGPPLYDAHQRRANQRQAPYSHDARMRALHTVEGLPSYHHHQHHNPHHHHGPPAPLDMPPAGPRAPPTNAQRVLLVRSQHAPYHTPGLPPSTAYAPNPPPQYQQPRNADQGPAGRVRDRPASDRTHANNNKADRGGGGGGGNGSNPDRPVSVGRRAPHFVVDLDYQPAESGRRATSRRHRGRNPMDASGSSGDTSAANSPMAAGGAAPAPLSDRKPLPQQQQQQQALSQQGQGQAATPQQQQQQQGRGGKSGRQAPAGNGVGGSAPLRHGGHNPLFTSPAAPGQPLHPAMMQHAASRLQGLQTQANGQDLRQFIALFESFVQQQLGGVPGGAPGAPPATPPATLAGLASTGGSAPPVSPVQQQHRTPTYLPIPQPSTPPASLPGVAPLGGAKQPSGKKGKNKAARPAADGSTPEPQQNGQRPLTPTDGTTTPPPSGGRPQGQQQQQGQGQGHGRKGKGAGTPAQGAGGRGGKGGAAGQEGGGGQQENGGGSGGEGGNGNGAAAASGEGMGKKRTKKDYATWAAATSEFRAQSAAMYAGANGGAQAGGAAGGAPVVGTPPQAPAPVKEAPATGPRVPDGTRGFGMGRGRPMAPPL